MSTAVDHHAAQRAIVRMLYDPRFAESVRANPTGCGLPLPVATLLATIDPRALAADPQRRRRTLGTLAEEMKASTVLALAESRSISLLDSFFASQEFHRAVEEERPLVLAYAAYLSRLCATNWLLFPALADVIALEEMQARARRESAPVAPFAGQPFARVQLAPGVLFRVLAANVLHTLHKTEELLFELSLVPALGLAADAPRLAAPPLDPDQPPLALLTVPLDSGLSLVTLTNELRAVIEPISAAGSLSWDDALAAAVKNGLAPEAALAHLLELADSEVICAAPIAPSL